MSLRGADLLARTLAAAGARQVFALSGNHVMPIYDAAIEAKLSLLHVRHEAAAVHMADAWSRLTGEVGIALVTGGPGHANAVSALYTALMAEAPVVLLSGHAPLSELGKGAFQEMRQADMAAPVCKASWTAQSTDTLGADVAKALAIAREGRPGPVHLSVPNDVLDGRTDAPVPSLSSAPSQERGALPEALLRASRPVVIVGPAGMRDRDAVRAFEEAAGIPVIGMESPRGVNDPSLGRLAKVLAQADVVLLAGKRRDFTLKFGRAFAADAVVLESAGLPAEARRPRDGWLDEVKSMLAYRPPEWSKLQAAPGGPLHPVVVCRAVQGLLDHPDAVLVVDGGEFGQWAQACLGAPHRVINGVAGSIGAALPLAAAAKLAKPHAPVVAMLGDGTFGFHSSEIDTAVRYGLGYLAVVGNDACWNAEYQIQLRAYGKERAHGLDLLPTRYGAVAAAFGGHGEDFTAGSLEETLKRASGTGKPAVVNVPIERLPAPTY